MKKVVFIIVFLIDVIFQEVSEAELKINEQIREIFFPSCEKPIVKMINF